MRDHNGGTTCEERQERILNERLALRIERAGRFVKQQDGRVLQNRPRDRHPLTLSSRQLHSALPHERLIPPWQRLDEIRRVRELRGSAHLCIRGVWPSDADIVRNRPMEHRGVLRHVADHFPESRLRDTVDRLPSDDDLPDVQVGEA